MKIKNMIKKAAKTVFLAGVLLANNPAYAQSRLPMSEDDRTQIVQTVKENQTQNAKTKYDLVKQRFEPKVAVYQNKLEKAREDFKKALEDGNLTVKEQKRIHNDYLTAILYRDFEIFMEIPDDLNRGDPYVIITDGFRGFRHFEAKDERLKFPESDTILYNQISKNLYVFDFGVPSLEKVLNKEFESQGVKIKVERRTSILEYSLIAGLIGLGIYASKKKK